MKAEYSWIKKLKKKGIEITGIFKELAKKDWAEPCKVIKVKKGEDFIKPDHQADCLYIVAKGWVGVGDEKILNREYCIEKLSLTEGSILLDFEAPMNIDGIDYPSILSQNYAWSTSELLSKVMVYTRFEKPRNSKTPPKITERERFGEIAILLKIHREIIHEFVKDEKLKTYMYKDAFHKTRQYWLLEQDIAYEPGMKDEAIANRIYSLWLHYKTNRIDTNNEVYILSKDRMEAILGIPGGGHRTNKKLMAKESPIDMAKPILERQYRLKLANIDHTNLPKILKEFYDYAYPFRRGKKPLPYKIEIMGDNK